MRRHAGAHDLAVGVGHGGVALDVSILVHRRDERDQASHAEEQEEQQQEEEGHHAAQLLEVEVRLYTGEQRRAVRV